MPEEPVFKVTNKMFQMLSDMQEKLEDGTLPDPVAESETSTRSISTEDSQEKSVKKNQ